MTSQFFYCFFATFPSEGRGLLPNSTPPMEGGGPEGRGLVVGSRAALAFFGKKVTVRSDDGLLVVGSRARGQKGEVIPIKPSSLKRVPEGRVMARAKRGVLFRPQGGCLVFHSRQAGCMVF